MRPTSYPCAMRAALITIGLAAFGAAPALAQQAPSDPIDSLLYGKPTPKDVDPEEPDTGAAGGQVEAEPAGPAATPHAPPSPTSLTQPVYLDETGKNPDGPPTPAEVAYDARLKSSMASAQAFQGPMGGGWTLSDGGRELYALQLVDEDGAIQGAWRDLQRVGLRDGSGFLDEAQITDTGLTLRFAGGVVTLSPSGDGRWSGDLTVDGRHETVSLRRRP